MDPMRIAENSIILVNGKEFIKRGSGPDRGKYVYVWHINLGDQSVSLSHFYIDILLTWFVI